MKIDVSKIHKLRVEQWKGDETRHAVQRQDKKRGDELGFLKRYRISSEF